MVVDGRVAPDQVTQESKMDGLKQMWFARIRQAGHEEITTKRVESFTGCMLTAKQLIGHTKELTQSISVDYVPIWIREYECELTVKAKITGERFGYAPSREGFRSLVQDALAKIQPIQDDGLEVSSLVVDIKGED